MTDWRTPLNFQIIRMAGMPRHKRSPNRNGLMTGEEKAFLFIFLTPSF
jgi:hypothetical protein